MKHGKQKPLERGVRCMAYQKIRTDKNRRQLEKGERYDAAADRYVFQKQINGRRVTITAKSLSELRKQKNELLTEMDKGFFRETDKMTLDDYFDHWISLYAESGRKATSVTNYKSYYEGNVRGKLGKRLMKDITKADCQKLINAMIREGKKHSTLANMKSCLNILFESAIDDRIIYVNPVKNIKLPQTDCMVRTAVDENELDLFMDYVKNDERFKYAYPAFVCLFNLGLRCGELSALTWGDVSFENNEIRINKSLNRYRKKDYGFTIGIASCKSKSSNRTIRMNSMVRKTLLEHRLKGNVPKLKLPRVDDVGIVRGEVQGFLFVNAVGNAWNEPSFLELINRIVDSYNENAKRENKKTIKRFTPHMARHTFTSLCYDRDVDVKAVSEYLGHKSTATTLNTYTHLSQEKRRAQEELIDTIKIG